MKKIIVSTKNYVRRNKTTLVLTTVGTLAGIAVLQHYGIKSLNAFLVEKGLDQEYYSFDLQA